jgi:hypothetical protein
MTRPDDPRIDLDVLRAAPPDATELLISNRQGYAQAANYAIHLEAIFMGFRALFAPRPWGPKLYAAGPFCEHGDEQPESNR